jgi:hypothetical protein
MNFEKLCKSNDIFLYYIAPKFLTITSEIIFYY